MATASMALQVNTTQEMESMIQGYIAQGFNIANRTPTSVTLIKRKEFSVLWAVIGFLVCLLPLLIYLIVYAAQSDQMVTITLAGAQPAAGYGTPAIASPAAAVSNPGYGISQPLASMPGYGTPQPAAAAAGNPGYQLSPDGQYFWDGQQWRPIAQFPAQTGPLPGQTSPLAGQSGPLYGQSGPLPDQSAATYQQPQADPSVGYYAQQQAQPQPQQPDPNQGQSSPQYGQDQGQGGYSTYPSSDPGTATGSGQSGPLQ